MDIKNFISTVFASFIFIFFMLNGASASTWTQTTQSDWKSGSLNNLNADITPGDMTLTENLQTYTDNTFDDFNKGYPAGNDYTTRVNSGGNVTLSQNFNYNQFSSPALTDDDVRWLAYDANHHYLYVANYAGVDVIDMKGTISTQDDQKIFTYSASSSPSISGNDVQFIKLEGNLLYAHTNHGVTVIDTKGTATTSDDIQAGLYTTTSTPSIPNNLSNRSFYNDQNHLLYIATFGGVTVLDTHGTATSSDDTKLITYSTSNGYLTTNLVNDVWVDKTKGLVYIGDINGLEVIDTKNTLAVGDDTTVFRYNKQSNPRLIGENIQSSWLNPNNGYLYINAYYGATVINTQGTATTSDDTVVTYYNSTSTIPLTDNMPSMSYLSPDTGYLYFSNFQGTTVIDTKKTDAVNDDSIVAIYQASTSPAYALHQSSLAVNEENNVAYIGNEYNGVTVVKPGYNDIGAYISNPVSSSTIQAHNLSWDAAVPAGTGVSVQTRSGSSSLLWKDNYNDGDTSNVQEYISGGTFATATESGGILTLSGNTEDGYGANFIISTGKPVDYFPAGSIVKVRLRMNNDYEDFSGTVSLGYYDTIYDFQQTNQWLDLTLFASQPFSYLYFELFWGDASSWNNATDSFQIESIRIEQPAGWSGWSNVYTNPYGSAITSPNNDYLQYRAVLTSDSLNNTPALNSLTFAKGYQSSGTYNSPIYDTGASSDWGTLSWALDAPTSTSISFKVRSGNQSNLSDASNFNDLNQTILNGSTDLSALPGMADGQRYVQYQAAFATIDPLKTAALKSVSLDFTAHQQAQQGGIIFIPSSPAVAKTTPEAVTPITALQTPAETLTPELISKIIDLSTAPSNVVNQVSQTEANSILTAADAITTDNSALGLYQELVANSTAPIDPIIKNSIVNFISAGTQTTLDLGAGERTGVVDSFVFAFGKYPQTADDWSDIIKIANGRWPTQVNNEAEAEATQKFKTIYLREPDRLNNRDDAAVVIMAYGLRPAIRDLAKEARAIEIFIDIFGISPESAGDWDAVRAIAYSGATR